MTKKWFGLALVLALACGDDDGPPTMDGGMEMDGGGRDGGQVDTGVDGGRDSGSCIDEDDDGYGEGCALGPDCDDENANASPAGTETCDGADNDCDGTTDEDLTGPSCGLTDGVCAGATARCGGEDGFLACDATDYGADYEATEAACDGLDNDCDGTTDEGCPCEDGETQACGIDVGACMPGTQTCTGGTFGACVGEVGPMGESCNGLDDDCDGMMDEPGDLTPPACPLQQGVCAGSVRACGGVAGWIACAGVASYGGDYQATESLCDGLDNDCDGIVDEGCTCIDGATQACGSDVGVCMAGTQTCTAGSWGGCAGEVAPATESCNGLDDDCDGSPDDGLTGPACALQQGVCAGSRQRCSGAGGFVACTATEYGARYQATESTCDGFDNDCDGMVDEGCDCVDGATQACGSSVGACERGTQTCAGGEWGACTGGVTPVPETCNGQDDDCNGLTDDALVAPACALTAGVCEGSTQVCAGAAGWTACAGTDSYGVNYAMTEDGATNEAICDGLDNDCDGEVDDGCTSGPILFGTNDIVSPSIHGQHVVYLENFDGNWDVGFANFNSSAAPTRLTTTPASEAAPRVRGNHLVFLRGDGAARRAVHVDLTTGVERVISTRQTGRAEIDGGTIVYDEFDGTQWDIFLYDIATATASPLFTEPSLENELDPVLRGSRLAFVTFDAMDRLVTVVVDFGESPPAVQVQTPAASSVHGQRLPVLSHASVGWIDGRAITTPTATETSNWDAYGGSFGVLTTVFPMEAALSTAVGAQLLNDNDGLFMVWTDLSRSNGDVAIGSLGSAPSFLTSSAATQASPAISGNVVLWTDNRTGTFDIYGSSFAVAQVPEAGFVVINEILADPPAGADVSGDGMVSSTNDEFIELVNMTVVALDLSGMTISDTMTRHTFPPGTVLPPLGTLVVFGGGGVPNGLFGGALVTRASTGTLSLNNDGDTVTLRRGGTVIDAVTYNSTIANMDESIVRMTEGDVAATMVRHTTLRAGVRYSPGTRASGFAF